MTGKARVDVVALGFGFAAFYVFLRRVIYPNDYGVMVFVGEILGPKAVSPYAYRLLATYFIRGVASLISASHLAEPRTSYMLAYSVFSLGAIEFSLLALVRLLRLWFNPVLCVTGAALFCGMAAVAAHDQFFQPWTLLEVGFYAIAIVLGAKNRSLRWAALLTGIATLNRETGLFVPVFYAAALPGPWRERRRLASILALELVWLAVFVGLRLARGLKPHPTDIAFHARVNFQAFMLLRSSVTIAAFFSMNFAALFGWRRAPQAIKRCLLIVPAYAALVLLFSIWREVRLWLPLSCVLLPFSLAGIESLAAPSDAVVPEAPSRKAR
jgi:hypothetical protein